MKENKNKWLHVRLSEADYQKLQLQFSKAKDKKLSVYIRKVLLGGPVVYTYQNKSLDEIVAVLAKLQNDLNGLANNYNQVVHKLHTLRDIPEFAAWVLTYGRDHKRLQEEIAGIKSFIRQTAEQWLQS